MRRSRMSSLVTRCCAEVGLKMAYLWFRVHTFQTGFGLAGVPGTSGHGFCS